LISFSTGYVHPRWNDDFNKEKGVLMPKKIFFIVMVGALLLSACTSNNAATPTAADTEAATETMTAETDVADETATDEAPADPTSSLTIEMGEPMPCTSPLSYEPSEEAQFYQTVADQLPPVGEDDWVRGDPDAPFTIIEYADFQCPACAYYASLFEFLMENFPGAFQVVFRHMPLPSIHDKAYISSMAADAAGAQDKFWDMYNILYFNQDSWSGFTEDEFIDWVTTQAEGLELDIDQFTADMLDEADRAALEENTNDLLNLGVVYTPFVIVDGEIYKDGNPNFFDLASIAAYDGYAECPAWMIDLEKTYTAVIDTNVGEVTVDLYPDQAPLAVNSFIFLAQNGWFDDLYFFRVEEDFVAQAGDPINQGYLGPGYVFDDEISGTLSFDKAGVLGMAKSGEDMNGSQFFITLGPTTNLDGGFTIFGQVQEDSLSTLDDFAMRDPTTATDFEGTTQIKSIEIIED
jgi:cyclophilin family peptidyl-prolyl cis-trans isomerase/protein-disulfide isomerase